MCFSFSEHLDFLRYLIPLLFLAGYGVMKKLKAARAVADERLSGSIMPAVSAARLLLRRLLQFSGIVLLVLAMAGPELCRGGKPVRRKGIDIVFMLDVSNSMLARDLLPDRLGRARSEILQISRSISAGRKALVLFAGAPFVQCPLTSDQDAFEALLDVASPELIESQGTVYRKAFDMVLDVFESSGSVPEERLGGDRVVVLLSDGEDHDLNFGESAGELKSRGIRLFAVGVGGTGGVPVPLRVPGDTVTVLKRDGSGTVVLTRFVPEVFRDLVRASGGRFFHSRPGMPVHQPVSEAINRIAAGSRWVLVPSERTPLHRSFIAAGLLLLFVEMLTDDAPPFRRRRMHSSGQR
jgi:Ca-activated chloride channel family protein